MLSVAYRELGDMEKSAAESNRAQRLSAEYAQWEKENMSRLISLSKSVEKMSSGQPRVEWQDLRPPTAPDPRTAELETMYSQVIVNAHERLGLIAAENGRFEEAVTEFERVAALEANLPYIDYNLGLAAFRAQRMAEAVAALGRAVEHDPSDLRARELLGRAQFEVGNREAALPNLEATRSAHEGDPGLLLALGTYLERARQTEEAGEIFRELVEKHSSLPELHLFLGQAAYAERRASAAEGELRRALELDPKTPQGHRFLGLIALDRGDQAKLPPLLIMQGELDDNVRPAVQEKFVTSYRAAGGECQYEVFAGCEHLWIREPGPQTDRAYDTLKTFIARQLSKKRLAA